METWYLFISHQSIILMRTLLKVLKWYLDEFHFINTLIYCIYVNQAHIIYKR